MKKPETEIHKTQQPSQGGKNGTGEESESGEMEQGECPTGCDEHGYTIEYSSGPQGNQGGN